jgi:hypothetical protein
MKDDQDSLMTTKSHPATQQLDPLQMAEVAVLAHTLVVPMMCVMLMTQMVEPLLMTAMSVCVYTPMMTQMLAPLLTTAVSVRLCERERCPVVPAR